jgi:hypothetical protein
MAFSPASADISRRANRRSANGTRPGRHDRVSPVAVAAKRMLAALALAAAGIAAADAQSESAFQYTQTVEAVCRSYAGAQVGQPPELAFSQCMMSRHCQEAPGASGYECEPPGPLQWHGGGY